MISNRAVLEICQVEFIASHAKIGGQCAEIRELVGMPDQRELNFFVAPPSNRQISQAPSGAAAILPRPIDLGIISAKLVAGFVNLSKSSPELANSAAATSAVEALKSLYVAAHASKRIESSRLFRTGDVPVAPRIPTVSPGGRILRQSSSLIRVLLEATFG